MAQVLTTAFISLAWTCLFLSGIIMVDVEDLKEPMVYAVVISFYCYNLNNVKSFYVSILTSHSFRQTFIKAFISLLPRRIRQRMRSSNPNNSTSARVNIREEILLQLM